MNGKQHVKSSAAVITSFRSSEQGMGVTHSGPVFKVASSSELPRFPRGAVVAPASIPDAAFPNPPDEILMTKIAESGSPALQLLVNRYSRLLIRIAMRILHDYGEAQEVVQEVFLYAYQKSSAFDSSKGSARGWLVQLAYHRAFDRRAFLVRRGFYSGTDLATLTDTVSGNTDLEREIGSRLSREQLERAFQQLPHRQHRTLEMFYFEGLELREIADRIGEPLGNVRHHYYRALKKLQKSAIVQNLRER